MYEPLLFFMGLAITFIVGLAVWSVGQIETGEETARSRDGRGQSQDGDLS